MNLSKIWVDPKGDCAMVLMTNIGGEKADQALDELATPPKHPPLLPDSNTPYAIANIPLQIASSGSPV